MTAVSPFVILVIDDERGPRESLRMLLKNEYRVLCAESVRQGLDLLRERHPHLIIMDIRMPEIDGIEGLRLIREIDTQVPVVLLTGYGTLETAQEALRLGANDYLNKPFETDDLIHSIRGYIEQGMITRKHFEKDRELRELNQRLKDEIMQQNHMAALGQASAELVHDLRNPMTVLYGYVQLLSQNLRNTFDNPTALSSRVLADLDQMEKSITRCTELINVWQNLARKDPGSVTPVDVADMLSDVITDMREAARKQRATIKEPDRHHACIVLGDRTQLSRVFRNLIGNALESLAMDGNGRVRIDVGKAKGHVRIRVEDNGCGIPKDVQQKMMDAYVTTKRGHKGSGLGLFISRKIISDHNGKITCTSKVGVGSRFTVELPSWTDITGAE